MRSQYITKLEFIDNLSSFIRKKLVVICIISIDFFILILSNNISSLVWDFDKKSQTKMSKHQVFILLIE
jgi:hypothetical protein